MCELGALCALEVNDVCNPPYVLNVFITLDFKCRFFPFSCNFPI